MRLEAQHFELIAGLLSEGYEMSLTDARSKAVMTRTIMRFTDQLTLTNPRFDRDRFMAAAMTTRGSKQ